MDIFTERLNKLIGSRKGKAKELADHLGVNTQAVYHWKAGKGFPTIDNLDKIADFYGVTTDYLLGRDTKTDRAINTEKKNGYLAGLRLGSDYAAYMSRQLDELIEDYRSGKRKFLT